MKVVVDLPPNIADILQVFSPKDGVVFTYGETLYNPSNIKISPDLMAHEEVHKRQQLEMGVKEWWEKYLINPAFRASQEVEAHQMQFRTIKKLIKDREKIHRARMFLAKCLSSDLYGEMISYDEAYKVLDAPGLYTFRA